MRWIPSTLSHAFTHGSGRQIFIRRHGVTQCSEFDELLRSSKLLIQPAHMRFSIKGESKGVHKRKKQHRAISPSSTASPTTTWSMPSASSGVIPVHVPIYKPAKGKVWPHAMYTIDMAVGFQQMNVPSFRTRFNQETLFSLIFGDTPFVQTTYHQNRKFWSETEPTILEMHKKAGRTPDGLWSNYLTARSRALGEVDDGLT